MEAVFTSSAFRHGYTKQDFYKLLAGDYLKIRSQRGLELARQRTTDATTLARIWLAERLKRELIAGDYLTNTHSSPTAAPSMKKMERLLI